MAVAFVGKGEEEGDLGGELLDHPAKGVAGEEDEARKWLRLAHPLPQRRHVGVRDERLPKVGGEPDGVGEGDARGRRHCKGEVAPVTRHAVAVRLTRT
eukprot:2670413-Pleurochrysis_carterae.AAC.3